MKRILTKQIKSLRSLKVQILGPLILVVIILTATLINILANVQSRFGDLRHLIQENRYMSEVVGDALSRHDQMRENLILYRLDRTPRGLRRLTKFRTDHNKFIAELPVDKVMDTTSRKILANYVSGVVAMEQLRDRYVKAVQDYHDTHALNIFGDLLTLHQIMDAQLSDLVRTLRNDLRDSEDKMNDLLVNTTMYFILVMVLVIAILWFTVWMYRRQIIQPLGKVSVVFKDIAAGQLNQSIDPRGVPVEIKGIAHDFNEMAISLREKTQELLRAEKKATEAARIKSEFLANMSHDIRTPMNSIVGIVDLLKSQKLPTEMVAEIEVLEKSSHVLLNLINSILDYSSLESGKLTLDHSPFDLRESLARIVDIIRPTAINKSLKLTSWVDPQMPSQIYGDAKRFEQILLNLLSNAVKFTSKGEVSIRIVRAPISHAERNQMFIEVKDTGSGIPESKLSQIFERFTRIEQEATKGLTGSGLGLSIVKQLTQLMGGSIQAESKEGEGSSINVCLPFESVFIKDQQVSKPLPVPRDIEWKSTACMLLVDDVPENRFIVKAFLSQLPVEIVEAENGEEALEAYEKKSFDLILMDMQMPILDGYDATKEIRRRETMSGKRVPVIALSAYSMPREIQRSLEAGCDSHLTKPMKKDDLIEAVSVYLGTATFGDSIP